MCKIIGCENKVKTKGYCSNHYTQRGKGKEDDEMEYLIKIRNGKCIYSGCLNAGFSDSNSLCSIHSPLAEKGKLDLDKLLNKKYKKLCEKEGCNKRVNSSTYCSEHSRELYLEKSSDDLSKIRRIQSAIQGIQQNDFCDIKGCQGCRKSKGLCARHYRKSVGGTTTSEMKPLKVGQKWNYEPLVRCSTEGCEYLADIGILCYKHYNSENRKIKMKNLKQTQS